MAKTPAGPEPEPVGPPRKPHWWDGYIAPLTEDERKRSIEDPGPSWSEFLLWQYMKWLGGLFFLIVDSLLILTFLSPLNLVALVPALILALYLEYLLWQYLWYRPRLVDGMGHLDPDFRPSWHHPVAFGRWTPEAKAVKAGENLAAPRGPDPREFL